MLRAYGVACMATTDPYLFVATDLRRWYNLLDLIHHNDEMAVLVT